MHRDFWQREESFTYGERAKPQRPSIDGDTALIMSLILLLKTDKSDPVLILALLYILS